MRIDAKAVMQNRKCKIENAKCKSDILHFAFCIFYFALLNQADDRENTLLSLPIRFQPLPFFRAGSPADCVRLALVHLAPEFEWVISGINAGGNLGTDVYHSGTVAAAREAVAPSEPIAFAFVSRQGGFAITAITEEDLAVPVSPRTTLKWPKV